MFQPIWVFPEPNLHARGVYSSDSEGHKARLLQQCGVSAAYSDLCEYSSVLIPIHDAAASFLRPLPATLSEQMPSASIRADFPFHTSAAIAALIETVEGIQL